MPDIDPAETEQLLRDQAAPIARRMAAWSVTRYPPIAPLDLLDDRLSDALEGAWRATREWQASDRGKPLGAYVSTTCHKRIVDGIRHRLGRTGTARSDAHMRTLSIDVALDADAAGLVDRHGAVFASLVHVEPGYQAVEDAADRALLAERVDQAVDRLAAHDETLAEAARWVWLQGGTQASLAQRVGLTEGAIAYRLRRARAWLQPRLADVA